MVSMTDAGAQEAADAGSNVTITVAATGASSAPPDLAVVDGAVEASASSADAARSTVAENAFGMRGALAGETVRELRSDALEEAHLGARTDADVVASATGIEVTAVQSVQTADGGVGPVLSEAGRGDGTTFDPGPVTVTTHVTATYAAS